MHGRRILFYDPDPKVQRIAERALIATGSDVDIATNQVDLLKLIEADGYDLLIVNFDPPMRGDPKWSEVFDILAVRFPRTRLVLHATAQSEDYLPLMAERRFVRNLIAKNDEPLEPDELIVTAEKLLRNDLFGLDKYLLWGVEPIRLAIRDSRDKVGYVKEVARYAARLGCNDRTVEMIETVVDELA